MNVSTLKHILSEEFHAKTEGEDVYLVDPDHKVSLLINQGSGLMPIPRVKKVRFHQQFLVVASDEDVYYVDPDTIFALKATDPAQDKEEKRPGFRH